MTLSIIIPIYNVEQYIEKCLLSVIGQRDVSPQDYEIILVDDGSPDGSAAIARRVTEGRPNVTFLTQENAGLSAARNTGMAAAKGDYVWCIDSDDCILPHAVRFLLDEIAKGQVDFITLSARDSNAQALRNTLTVTTAPKALLQNDWSPCAPFFVYRRAFLQQHALTFFPGIYHEDMEFTPRMMYLAKSCRVTNELLYIVTINPGSITRCPKAKNSYDCLIVARHLADFCGSTVHEAGVKQKFHDTIAMVVNNALANIAPHPEEEHRRFNGYMDQLRRDIFPSLRGARQRKYRIEHQLFRLCRPHYVGVYRLLCKFK